LRRISLIEEALTQLAKKQAGNADEKQRKIDQKVVVGGSGTGFNVGFNVS